MPIPLAAPGNLTIIYRLDWAYMQAPQALYTLMLPDRLSLRPLNIFSGTDAFTHPAGSTFIFVTQKVIIDFLLPCQPFIMVSATKILQQLPCGMGFPRIYDICYILQLASGQPCSDTYSPLCRNISIRNVIGDQPHIP